MSPKNVAKLRRKTGLPIVKVMVRGGTDHRKDLWLEDGTCVSLWPDGSTLLADGSVAPGGTTEAETA